MAISDYLHWIKSIKSENICRPFKKADEQALYSPNIYKHEYATRDIINRLMENNIIAFQADEDITRLSDNPLFMLDLQMTGCFEAEPITSVRLKIEMNIVSSHQIHFRFREQTGKSGKDGKAGTFYLNIGEVDIINTPIKTQDKTSYRGAVIVTRKSNSKTRGLISSRLGDKAIHNFAKSVGLYFLYYLQNYELYTKRENERNKRLFRLQQIWGSENEDSSKEMSKIKNAYTEKIAEKEIKINNLNDMIIQSKAELQTYAKKNQELQDTIKKLKRIQNKKADEQKLTTAQELRNNKQLCKQIEQLQADLENAKKRTRKCHP